MHIKIKQILEFILILFPSVHTPLLPSFLPTIKYQQQKGLLYIHVITGNYIY